MTSSAAPISVVVPCHNAEAYVRDAIASVQAQSHPPIEIICVDDGSTDGTLRVLNELASTDARIRVLTGPNRGAAAARNRGVAATEGTYVQFLDADDCLQPEKLAHQWALVDQSPIPPDIVFGAFDVVPYAEETPSENWLFRAVDPDPWCGLIRGIGSPRGCGNMCSNLWRTAALRAVGGMQEQLRIGEDNRLVFDLLAAGGHVVIDQASHTLIRIRVDSLRTSNGAHIAKNQVEYRGAILKHLRTKGQLTRGRERLLAAELIRYIGAFHRHDPHRAREQFARAFSTVPFREAYAERGLLYAIVLAVAGFRWAESVRWRRERLRERWHRVFGA